MEYLNQRGNDDKCFVLFRSGRAEPLSESSSLRLCDPDVPDWWEASQGLMGGEHGA